jgi:AcrR family transcriptional regulator
MGKKHGPNKENLEATRRIFLNIARKEFSTRGYYNASTAAIVEESGMARGSLYYHFGDKKGCSAPSMRN